MVCRFRESKVLELAGMQETNVTWFICNLPYIRSSIIHSFRTAKHTREVISRSVIRYVDSSSRSDDGFETLIFQNFFRFKLG